MRLAEARQRRRAMASLTLALFVFQSYLVQTHIHLLLQGVSGSVVQTSATGSAAEPASAGGKLPPADNPATCPICLDMVSAGHFTAPGAIALPLPPQIATTIAAALAIPVYVIAISHIWLGRAPPKR